MIILYSAKEEISWMGVDPINYYKIMFCYHTLFAGGCNKLSCAAYLFAFFDIYIDFLSYLILIYKALKLLDTFTILLKIIGITIQTEWIWSINTDFAVPLLCTHLRSIRFNLAAFVDSKFS